MNNALIVLHILKKYSSEDNCLTAQEINEKIAEEWPGIYLNRGTIYSAINHLKDYGRATKEFDIVSEGKKGCYYRQTLLSAADIRQIIESIKKNDVYPEESKKYLVETFLKLAVPPSVQEDILERETKSLPKGGKKNGCDAFVR